jgi:hypothetical protein
MHSYARLEIPATIRLLWQSMIPVIATKIRQKDPPGVRPVTGAL